MLIHQVYFWLKESLSADEQQKFVNGVQSLAQISSLKMSHLGVPASTDRPVIDRSYSYAWLTVFDDMAAHDAYQEDPIHLKFVDECATLWDRVQIYDAEDPQA